MEEISETPSQSVSQSVTSKGARIKDMTSVILSNISIIMISLENVKSIEKLIYSNETFNLYGSVNIEKLVANPVDYEYLVCYFVHCYQGDRLQDCWSALQDALDIYHYTARSLVSLLNSYIALGALDDINNKLVGALLVYTYPNVGIIPPWEWDYWLKKKYGIYDVLPRNTLFVHFSACAPEYRMFFMRPLIRHLFKMRNFLKYCIIVIPPGKHNLDFLGDMGVKVFPKVVIKVKGQYLYMFCRKDFQIQYKIRKAVEEDNDDLVPLIETHSKKLTELYGRYYIAEILKSGKLLGRHIIVAEYQNTAVAVLILNSTVNYKVLNEDFELVPYNGLKKPHAEDIGESSLEYIPKYTSSLEQIRRSRPSEDEILDIIERRSERSEPAAEMEDEEVFMTVSLTESDEFSLVFTSASMFVFQEEEEKPTVDWNSESHSVSSEAILSQHLNIQEQDTDDNIMDWVSGYSATKGMVQKIPEFKGEENAFSLEVAACLPQHQYGLIMLFEAAFECFHERDYCVMAVPSTTNIIKLTKYFGRVVPRSMGSFPSELYVMHKSTIMGEIAVEVASNDHEKQIKQLCSTISNGLMAVQLYENSIANTKSLYSSFVMLCDKEVIGMAIVSEEIDLDYLTSHYNLSDVHATSFSPGSHGIIEIFIISPIFQRHDKFFLRDIHRLCDYSILFYRHSPYDSSEYYRERPLVNNIQNLLPVLPIMQPEYDIALLKNEECAPSDVVTDKKDPFALYVSTVNLTSLSRQVINTKIVVVGCSHTALSFIQSLLFKQTTNQMVTYNNITMVCPNGLSHKKISNKIKEGFMVKKNFMDARYMDMISLKTYVNFVLGKVTKIDRKEQYIIINNDSFLAYDMLFLMIGEQFQKPTRPNKIPFQESPDNVFVINSALDANHAVNKLRHLYHKANDKNYVIIIYGHFLQAHATINGLISFGIGGHHLVLVEPFPYSMALEKRQRHNVSVYNNPEIDAVIYDSLREEGVKIYSSYYFIDWTYDVDSNHITKIKFESRHKMLEVECMGLFVFNEKEISPRVYNVINNAGLVYDGRLVIDSNCQTNDPRIFGAGTLTKYSRKYFAPNMAHKYYNRIEIGKRLGLQISQILIREKKTKGPHKVAGWNFHIERGDSLVPRYTEPIMRYCRLPGGLYYLSITKPGKRIPLETAVCMDNYGQVLITGNCRNLTKQGYFQLHLNEFKRIETITCLHKSIDPYNLHCLWGKHERLLNNLLLRFEMVLITDLFEYFREPWAYALYHEDFNTLLDELNMLMTSSVSTNGRGSLINDLISLYKQNKWDKISPEAKEALEEKFKRLGYPKYIERKVLNFIKQHLDLLPMYAHPIIIKDILKNYANSPLFT